MPARNCNSRSVSVQNPCLKALHGMAGSLARLSVPTALAILLTVSPARVLATPQQDTANGPSANQDQRAAATEAEVQQLKKQVSALQESLARVLSLLESRGSGQENPNAPVQPANPAPPAATPKSSVVSPENPPEPSPEGLPQYTARPTDRQIAIATKAQGGDLSGAGHLLRTDRVVVGGYGDFQFRTPSLSERADGGGTSTFQSTRFVLGIAAVLSKKQNITLNSEIEYELGTSEIDVEQAFISWRVRPEFDFRTGIIVPPLGRFNTYHDSNLNIMTLRPLINQFIVPTAYRDAGLGVRGVFRLPREMKLSYEANVLNGFQAANADGEATPFSRLLGQSSAAEPGLIAFQATRNSKAVAGRIGFSPILGLEFGLSGYGGTFTNQGDPKKSATIVFVDASYQRGPFVLNGEYGRSNIVGAGILRQSPAPPVVHPNDPLSIAALSDYVAQTSPGQDGFYVETGYKFFRGLFRNTERFDEGAYIMPVVRVETVRRDRTLSDFYLNQSRTTLGFNIAPSPNVIFKMNYVFNHTFGPVPNVAGAIGGADFGNNPQPYLDYGKNGFTGSVAYVF
jgi:hypothetical protein